jgi:hypothetical protein
MNQKNKRNNSLQLGDHLYYSTFSDKPKVRALVNTTKDALTPYYEFLTEAIKAEEKKGSYEIDWKYIESSYRLKITPVLTKFQIEKPKIIFKVIIEGESVLKESRNKLFFDEQDKTIRFNKSDVKINGNIILLDVDTLPLDNEILELNNNEVKYELENITLSKNDKLNKHIIQKIDTLDDGWNVYLKTDENLKEVIFQGIVLNLSKYPSSFEKLYDNNQSFNFEKIGHEFTCEVLPKSQILVDENKTEYRWEKQKKNSKSDIVIQLIDSLSVDNEKAISEYFFEDDVSSIYQGKNKRDSINIKSRRADDKILILAQDRKNPKSLIGNEPIKIKVDTNNLRKQQNSIRLLNNSPVKEQGNLIKLFERKNAKLWERPSTVDINDWYILNDESYDGTIDQRDFVKKAMGTDDFSILEGPPGSGKTTTILELILQLIKDGKKILLSASTHVAIDNVLERIEKYDKDNLVEALRIGREGSVGESISHLQIDKKIESYKSKGFSESMAKELVVDGANLVCGTTMGINQLPMLKDRERNTPLPLDPMFDYIIIDESSKTTFQEFLVPAMLAKKWVLVGDIKQLSPFIEQSHIIHNLNVSIPKDTQRAIRLVFETLHNNSNNPYIIEVSLKEELEIKKYLDYWSNQEEKPYKNKVVTYSDEKDLWKRLGSDLVLVEEGQWNEIKQSMPKTHLVILKKDREDDAFFFKQRYLNKKRKLPKYKQINRESSKENNPLEYKEFFKSMLKEKSWADEIAWRMIRVYERRMLKNPNSYYEETYELLKPVDENNSVDRIYNMTLPSILESLQVGNGEKHRNSTTITEGFDKRDLKERHETLKTQHRMAPDISKFSREEFYTNEDGVALKDASTIDREWNYGEYDKRAVWIDTPKQNTKNDRQHQDEVKVIIEEIKKFLEFAKDNPKNKQEESWSIGVLTYYKPQEKLLREALRKFCNQPNKMSRFSKDGIEILNYTVDKFQGMEADMIFLSMVRGKSIGFMDNINRLNVALTRAKYQRVIVGDQKFFKKQRGSDELKKLAENGGV